MDAGKQPTARQRQILVLLHRRPAPTLRELGEMLGIKSTNGVADHLDSLERHGWIRRVAFASRSCVLTEAGLAVIAIGPEAAEPAACGCQASGVATVLRGYAVLCPSGYSMPILNRRSPDTTQSAINFCPWCGRDLRAA